MEHAYHNAAEHPVTHDDGSPDYRYTVAQEFCGDQTPRYVARYCGEWIGKSISRGAAHMLCVGHNARRNGALVIEAQNA